MELDRLVLLAYASILLVVVPFLLSQLKRAGKRSKLKRMVRRADAMTPKQFFAWRNSFRGKMYQADFKGAYILYNASKRMYYVGQSVHVPSRVNAHLTGKGNGDVYADYKYGDRFEIRMLRLKGSGYKDLDSLERELISMYRCCEKGYNRQRGNS